MTRLMPTPHLLARIATLKPGDPFTLISGPDRFKEVNEEPDKWEYTFADEIDGEHLHFFFPKQGHGVDGKTFPLEHREGDLLFVGEAFYQWENCGRTEYSYNPPDVDHDETYSIVTEEEMAAEAARTILRVTATETVKRVQEVYPHQWIRAGAICPASLSGYDADTEAAGWDEIKNWYDSQHGPGSYQRNPWIALTEAEITERRA